MVDSPPLPNSKYVEQMMEVLMPPGRRVDYDERRCISRLMQNPATDFESTCFDPLAICMSRCDECRAKSRIFRNCIFRRSTRRRDASLED